MALCGIDRPAFLGSAVRAIVPLPALCRKEADDWRTEAPEAPMIITIQLTEESRCRPDSFRDEHFDHWMVALTATKCDVDFATNLWPQLYPCHAGRRAARRENSAPAPKFAQNRSTIHAMAPWIGARGIGGSLEHSVERHDPAQHDALVKHKERRAARSVGQCRLPVRPSRRLGASHHLIVCDDTPLHPTLCPIRFRTSASSMESPSIQ